MAQYFQISYPIGALGSNGLRKAITYLGKHYGRLANKKGRTNKEYLKSGEKFIARHCGRSCRAISRMTKPEEGNYPDNKQWYYHRRIYGKAYVYIIRLLRKRLLKDMENVTKLLNDLFHDIYREAEERGNNLERLYSNSLVYWQKEMLNLFANNHIIPIYDTDAAEKILDIINEVDKPLPTIV